MPEPIRAGLGDFLRSRRERLSPDAVGLPVRRRRRTPGLRREEVAELAGISIDWYVRLEQGRAVTPSPATIDALATALRLDSTEKAHLAALARTTTRPAFRRETVPAALSRMIDSLEQPAYITGVRWDLLAWNTAAAALFTDLDGVADDDRNILVYLVLHPAARRLFGAGWEIQTRHVVAQFRAMHDLWAPDPAFTELSERLRGRCAEFETWWNEHDVVDGGPGQKTLHHPVIGARTYHYATFQANEQPALKLTIYTPLEHQQSSV